MASCSAARRLIALLLLSLVCCQAVGAPAAAFAQAQSTPAIPNTAPGSTFYNGLNDRSVSSVADQKQQQWFDDAMPWDAGWRAFNDGSGSDAAENTEGACAFDGGQIKQVGALIEALRSDEENIASAKKNHDKNVPTFDQIYRQRLRGEQGMPDAADAVPLDPAVAKILRHEIPHAESLEDFKQSYYSSSQTGGCENKSGLKKIAAVLNAMKPGISEFLFNPLSLLIKLPFVTVGLIAAFAYQMVGDWALGWTLVTPHTERGDLIWDADAENHKADGATATKEISCQNRPEEMGFNCENIKAQNDPEKAPFWIKLAKVLRNGLSAVYGIVVISAILLYMFRRRDGGILDARRVLPRVVGSVVLAGMAPFLIGAAITLSNWMVGGILSIGTGSPSDQLMEAIINVGDHKGGLLTGPIANWISIVFMSGSLSYATFIMWSLVILAVLRQLALILLIILTPVAIVAMITDKGEHLFTFWVRGLAAVIGLPIIQALLFVSTTRLAFAFHEANTGIGFKSLIALIIMLAGLRALVKVGHAARGYVTGKRGGRAWGMRLTGMGLQVGGLAAAAVTGNPGFAKAGQVAGTTIKGAAERGEPSSAAWAARGSGAGRVPVPAAGSRTNPFSTRGLGAGGSSGGAGGSGGPGGGEKPPAVSAVARQAAGGAMDTVREATGRTGRDVAVRHSDASADFDFREHGFDDDDRTRMGVSAQENRSSVDAAATAVGAPAVVARAAGAVAGRLSGRAERKAAERVERRLPEGAAPRPPAPKTRTTPSGTRVDAALADDRTRGNGCTRQAAVAPPAHKRP